jgi:hypothetical protein
MKTISKFGLMIALAGSLFMSACAGSYYVTAQPVEPVYERPAVPYAGAVWIDGEYTWSGGTYVYVRGHWDRPRNGRAWVRGNWERTNRGYRWHRGHWG